jgi:hypothetical protein
MDLKMVINTTEPESSYPPSYHSSKEPSPKGSEVDLEKSSQISESDSDASILTKPPVFPEGGSKAWLVVLGCWCASFASYGILNSFGYVASTTHIRSRGC